jgi:hypothetical protein
VAAKVVTPPRWPSAVVLTAAPIRRHAVDGPRNHYSRRIRLSLRGEGASSRGLVFCVARNATRRNRDGDAEFLISVETSPKSLWPDRWPRVRQSLRGLSSTPPSKGVSSRALANSYFDGARFALTPTLYVRGFNHTLSEIDSDDVVRSLCGVRIGS